jgi:hypothetical protein
VTRKSSLTAITSMTTILGFGFFHPYMLIGPGTGPL